MIFMDLSCVFIGFIIFYVICGIITIVYYAKGNREQRIQNFALKILGQRRWLLDITMPVVLTVVFALIFNILMLIIQIPVSDVKFFTIPISNALIVGINL